MSSLVIDADGYDIVRKQILEEARSRDQLEHLIFITDDEKEDWWSIVNSGGSKRLGPRPELAEEIAFQSSISHIYMYNSERFLTFAERILKIPVKQKSVDQVRDVAQLSESSKRTSTISEELHERTSMAKQAVRKWVMRHHAPTVVSSTGAGFSDFEVFDEPGTREAYKVFYIRKPDIPSKRLDDALHRGTMS